jgi:flagellar protein FlaF
MNATELARRAYAPVQSPLRTARATEHQALAEATARLQGAADAAPPDFRRLASAIHENRRLWTLLAADVAGSDNALPPALRAQLFYLAEFTAIHSRQVLKGLANVGPLIDINTAVMRGLSGQSVAS